jgi:mannose-1-phosphate guanylyltransferase/phosphomannomutase
MQKQFVEKQNIKAVILVGSRDFGRSPLASRLPTALWPVAGKPALERLLVHLAEQGIEQVVICSSSEDSLLAESIHADNRLKFKFLDESLPLGTAGCLRVAASGKTDELIVIFPAGIVCPPKIQALINAHLEGKSDLTVMLNPSHGIDGQMSQASGIYVCNAGLLEHIPEGGYFDIKEGLIPEMLRAGKTVHAASLLNHAGNFRDRQEYLYAISNYLEECQKLNTDLKLYKSTDSKSVWIANNANVEQGARIYGPAVIMNSASISNGVVILGPTIIGRNVSIGKESVVVNSVLWDGTQVGQDCEIQRCVTDFRAVVRANTSLEEK